MFSPRLKSGASRADCGEKSQVDSGPTVEKSRIVTGGDPSDKCDCPGQLDPSSRNLLAS